MYIVLIADKHDTHDRHWVKRDTFVEANAVANAYTKDDTYTAEIYQSEQVF